MINASELRLGNWVYDFGRNPVQVIRLTLGKQPLEEPIPITNEIFESCGFKSKRKGLYLYYYKTYQRRLIDRIFEVSFNGEDFFFIEGNYVNDFKYLHQLQNLYFVLTGQELEIKL